MPACTTSASRLDDVERALAERDAEAVQRGLMPGGMRVRVRLCRSRRRALHRDRAHPARDPGVLRLREAGAAVSTSDERLARRASTEVPETVNAADVTSWSDEVDVLVIGFGIAGGCAAVSAAAAGARVLVLERAAAAGGTSAMAGGHFYLGGGTAVQEATGHQDSRRGDVQVPRRGVARTRARQDPRILRGQRRALQLAGGLGFSVRTQLLPGQGRRPAGHRGPVVHRQRKGVAVLRAGQARAARPLGAGARRAGRRRDGHRPARQTGRRARRGDPLRDRRDQPGRRRRCGGRRQLEALHRDRCDQGQGGRSSPRAVSR